MASSSEKTEVKVEFLSDIDLLLIVENVLERMKIEKFQNLVANFHDKAEYVICVRNLKQALNHVFGFKKVGRVIEFNEDGWLKPYIDMNTKARQKPKMIQRNNFFKLMGNAVLGKIYGTCDTTDTTLA